MVACYRSHPAGEAGIPETGGRNPDCRAYSASDDHLSIHFGHGAGGLRWLYATESPPFCGARTHAHGDLASVAAAAAMHVLEVSGVTAPWGSAASVDRPATDAATSVGSGERAAALRHPGHRYHGAHAVWPADGSPQGLQPEEQGEEKLPTHCDLYCGNARVDRRRVAQRRSA